MEKKKKDFDAVEWVHQVRDENYREYGHLPTREFLLALEKEAKEAEVKRNLLKQSSSNTTQAKPHSEPISKKKDFDAIEWVRSVRDENYKRLGHLPTSEYIHRLSEEGRQSKLWKELEEKAARSKKKQ